MQTRPEVTTWNAAACEAVREMVQRDSPAQELTALRTFYDEMSRRIQEPDIDDAILAAMWGEFGARCRASAATLAGQGLLWTTVIDTVISKQRDYGKENILRFGQFGLVVRTHDKLARLEHLKGSAATPNHESLLDTVLDLVGYSVIGLMLVRGWFDYPLV
jgi:hypothetical protein